MITIDDLIAGRRARITEKELSQLTGKSRSKYQKDRLFGKGLEFERDPQTGAISYSREVALAALNLPAHKSTSEYNSNARLQNIEKARQTRVSPITAQQF